jgi:hypothetical protein
MQKRKGPCQPNLAGRGAKKAKSPGNDLTTAAIEAQGRGLRFAIQRLDQSRNRLRCSLLEAQELWSLLKLCPGQNAVLHASRQEQRVRRTAAKISDVEESLFALYGVLARLEVQHGPR